MDQWTRRVVFGLFFLSGFSSLSYQMVWTRLAFASFGIVTPVLSVVLSVFMLGLALGSWAGGRFIAPLVQKTTVTPIAFYAAAELMIGLGAVTVPRLFALGGHLLLSSGQTNSGLYLSLSALMLTVALLPWCFCMGTTFPLMMAFVGERQDDRSGSFSFLYAANVLGAITGTFLTAIVLVELLGFQRTLWVAASGNVTIAIVSGWLGWRRRAVSPSMLGSANDSRRSAPGIAASKRTKGRLLDSQTARLRGPFVKWVLFATGFGAMASEVVWTRDFTPVLKTQVYSFALVVLIYLGATWVGSLWYRRHLSRHSTLPTSMLMGLLIVTVFLPILANDPRVVNSDWAYAINVGSALTVLASIVPICVVLGYLTPKLIDEYSAGDPAVAGNAYAVNVLGCILGPIVASYVLLPWMDCRYALVLLGLPFWALYFLAGKPPSRRQRVGTLATATAVLAAATLWADDFQHLVSARANRAEVRRDYAASVVSASLGNDDSKTLLVNGIGMTRLSPITKLMVHLPLAFHEGHPESALVICFGMGTTFRSAMSWGIDTTAVELVPSVPQAFGFYHADAQQVLANPKGHIVIDDGRRYLARTREKFDVIVVDPPPPPEAAGSSLLFSEEFGQLAKQRLNPHGIVQVWYIGQEFLVFQGLLRSVSNVFPYVRTFGSIEGWGIHILASMDPIEALTAEQLVARMPSAAQKDLMEWAPPGSPPSYLGSALARELPVRTSLHADRDIRITDDRPLNEYFLLRRLRLYGY
jgi:predicted membrane-bound spermidine synthase